MALVDAYDTRTGKKLAHLVPEHLIGHPVLGPNLSRLPSQATAETVQSLRDEIGRRNADRAPEDRIPVTGNKADLVAALAADDLRPTDPVNPPTEAPPAGDESKE